MIQSGAGQKREERYGKERKKPTWVKVGQHAVRCRHCSILEQCMLTQDLSYVTVDNTVTPSSVFNFRQLLCSVLKEMLYTVNHFGFEVFSYEQKLAKPHSPQTHKLNKIQLHSCSKKDWDYVLFLIVWDSSSVATIRRIESTQRTRLLSGPRDCFLVFWVSDLYPGCFSLNVLCITVYVKTCSEWRWTMSCAHFEWGYWVIGDRLTIFELKRQQKMNTWTIMITPP